MYILNDKSMALVRLYKPVVGYQDLILARDYNM